MAYFNCLDIGYCDTLTLVIYYLYLKLIISFHGASGSKDRFQSLVYLSEDTIQVRTFNFCGHGGQPLPGSSFSVAQFSEQVARYIQDMNIEKTNILAYSMHLPAG